MANMETIYRAWISSINDRRWDDVVQYMQPTYAHGSTDMISLNHQQFTAYHKHVLEVFGPDCSFTADAVVADAEAGCIAARCLAEVTLVQPFLGLQPNGKRVRFFETQFVWFEDQRVRELRRVPDLDDFRRQMSSRAEETTPDLMGLPLELPTSRHLDNAGLKSFYRSYIKAINEDLSESSLSEFCNPSVVHNAKTLSLSQYVSLIDDSSSAVREMTAHIHTIVADEKSQRIAARIEWSGEPIKTLAGIDPNGRSVRFPEHVIYQLEAGKIARVWAIVDWDSFRAQMTA
ncbi:hypothetical protein JX265_009326 [Neoarthrinium moseri]|uniref:SnoaL-like polyketide cyclase n=1 Tax=Neoarthrinium moseri TaxID=1658444 RepID=A0A9P9WG92_9PEZI|nr:uncharacterized protein JN550_012464 [Neoarthrinium moseri]KAI1841659.1 hypothetical protein JX266_012124 [Neoarthrinium moseri]KAI1858810.1 hypothetical protein JN550_012464 [Neoarthrinium moseri]KAI1861823.1 hypothetical protein JX265_009326 [Neoarthrinium moseri]